MTPEEFRAHGHAVVDWIADYRARVGSLPVMAQCAPGDVRRALPSSAPEQPEPFGDILRDLDAILLPAISHWQHPDFFGYFPANAALASVLGDFLSTGLGVIGLSWQSSPALTELEQQTCGWMRDLLGLAPAWQGVIQDTASTCSFVALTCARERSTGMALQRGGLQGHASTLVVYTSEQAHSSIPKAAMLAGFGKTQVRLVPCDAAYAMRPDALAAMMAEDHAAGRTPCAVVATTGTTTTTALDPIGAIVEVARPYGAWVHADAALAGSAMLLPECRWMWDGVDGADSIVVNAHKWLGVVFDCAMYYVRDPEHLVRVMSTNPSYLQTAADQDVANLRDWGVPLGRRFRALKLWCLLREQGTLALQARLRRDLENARWLEAEVRATPQWRVLAPAPLQLLCVRHEPAGLDGDALDLHTRAWADRLNASGAAYVTPAMLDGRWMVRISIGAEPTDRGAVARLWAAMQQVVQR
jgi:glutamate/tyrosine decarboxylase-like PLP-dependent enzyme